MREYLGLYPLKERIFFVKTFYKNDNDVNSVKTNYLLEFGEIEDIPSDQIINDVISLFEKTGNISDVPLEDVNASSVKTELADGARVENEIFLDTIKVEEPNWLDLVDPFRALDSSDGRRSRKQKLVTKIEDIVFEPEFKAQTKSKEIETKEEPHDEAEEADDDAEMDVDDPDDSDFDEEDHLADDVDYKPPYTNTKKKSGATEKIIPRPRLCRFCHKMIPSRYQLRRHVKAVHANDKPLPVPRVYKNPTPCKFCGMVFSGKHRRRLHYREVHPEEFARSKEMHKAQNTAEESQQTQDDEQQVATTVEQDTTQQKISNKKITAEDVIRESRQGAKEKDLPQYQCKFCKKMIPSKYQLRRHVKEVHANDEPEYENPIICKFCCRVFPNINQRRNHVRVDHPEEHSKIVKGFTKTPIEDRTCSYCGRICAKRSALDIHVKVMHTHESLAVCEYCGRGFPSLTHLRRHITVHTGERPFKCDYKDCGQSFREKTSFIVHQRRHTGEKPYQCEICGKSFKDQSTRKIHYRQHTGENPYSCELCGKTTKQKQNLKSHMKHFHKINNWDGKSTKGLKE